jgi:hypothetical protein
MQCLLRVTTSKTKLEGMKFHVRRIEEDMLAQTLTIANLMIDKVSRLQCRCILNEFLPVALTKKLSDRSELWQIPKPCSSKYQC